MQVTQSQPIELFYWTTPNGWKATIMLEELAVPYTVTFIDIGKDEQWTPDYETVSPNHQIPAIRDPEGPGDAPITVFESGAVLLYLARKFGKFYPQADERARTMVEEWLMFQMGSFGPFLGQAHHFNLAAPEEIPYAIERYRKIAERLYEVLDRRLAGREYIADDYSIADIALFGWALRFNRHRIDLDDYPSVRRWFDAIGARPAVQRGLAVKPRPSDV
ncbi:MAG: glutathione S-transferase [Hyphomicrobiales bacterium]|nr:glutathione S-transferase [Hyphomicrobiales bacterium]